MKNLFIDLLPTILLASMVFPHISIESKTTDIVATQKKMNKLRGFFAILIIVAHSIMSMNNVSVVLYPFSKLTTICVGYFFVCSGYGLMYSSANKQNYMNKHFLVNKPLFLFVVAVLTYFYFCIMILFTTLLTNKSLTTLKGIGNIWQSTNWYLKEQILLYIVFYLIYKFVRKPGRVAVCIILFTAIMCGLFCYLGVGRSFYISSMGFPAGICIYVFREKLENRTKFHILFV